MRRKQSRNEREALERHLHSFAMVYLGVVLVTLTIAGLVGSGWDLKYPNIQNPDLQFGYQVPLSKIAKPSKAYSDKKGILIAIDWKGLIYLDYKIITLDQLGQAVIQNVRFGNGTVYIKAHEGLQYGVVMRVLQRCAGSGANSIRILLEDRAY